MTHLSFQKSLLSWYHQNARKMPWRETKDPYAIWLSEIMLQQTTVATVIPYYERFLKEFPTLEDVAKAPEERLLTLWAGLGYYNRIRNFQKAARAVAESHEGKIPKDYNSLLSLPGLGSYTAAAVASIAFRKPHAVLDGNVMRVLSRLKAAPEDIGQPKTKTLFQKWADELLEKKNPGDFNQAMMELGATICTPRNPSCLLCPVHRHCKAYAKGCPEEFPVKKKKTNYVTEKLAVLVRIQDKKIFLRKRPKDEILSNQWEMPVFKTHGTPKGSCIRHSIMNRRIEAYPVHQIPKGFPKPVGAKWIPLTSLDNLPLTTLTRKVLKGILLTS